MNLNTEGDAQDRTGVRQTRPSGTSRHVLPARTAHAVHPLPETRKTQKAQKETLGQQQNREGFVDCCHRDCLCGCRRNSGYGVRYSAKHGYAEYLRCSADSYTSVIYDADDNEVDKLHGEENREYVKLSAITTNMQNAVIAIEDQRFYEHNGIDIRGILRAMKQNIVDSVKAGHIQLRRVQVR